MVVTTYHARSPDGGRVLLVVPQDIEPTVAEGHKAYSWQMLATTTLEDRLFASARPIVEAELSINGYAFLKLV